MLRVETLHKRVSGHVTGVICTNLSKATHACVRLGSMVELLLHDQKSCQREGCHNVGSEAIASKVMQQGRIFPV